MPAGMGSQMAADNPQPMTLQQRKLSATASMASFPPDATIPVKKISAQELMVSGSSYGGWIRKQGGSVRTCKSKMVDVQVCFVPSSGI